MALGPACDDDAYLDVVNIDRYDMIVGTPFMRKHGLILDFAKDTLTMQGTNIPMLTAGQEDLILAKKCMLCARTPIESNGQPVRKPQ